MQPGEAVAVCDPPINGGACDFVLERRIPSSGDVPRDTREDLCGHTPPFVARVRLAVDLGTGVRDCDACPPSDLRVDPSIRK
jgi:hypothetical protein